MRGESPGNAPMGAGDLSVSPFVGGMENPYKKTDIYFEYLTIFFDTC